MSRNFCRRFLFIAVLFLLPLIFILVSMMMGSYHTTPGEIFRIILGKMTGETAGVDEKTSQSVLDYPVSPGNGGLPGRRRALTLRSRISVDV